MPSALLRVMGCVLKQGNFMAPQADLSGKHILVTGSSLGGIGFETALGLSSFGAKLSLGSRNTEKGEAAAAAIKEKHPQAEVKVVKCDTSDLDSVRALAAHLTASGQPPVDVIVANAGALFDDYQTNDQDVEMTFATCALGHHLLLQLVEPGRVVWVTGDIYCMANGPADPLLKGSGQDAYNRASLGRLLLAKELRRRTSEKGNERPEVICVHPGVVATNFAGAGRVLKAAMNVVLITPQQGAQASIYAASCPSSDIPKDTVYFHNKRRWVTLAEDDKAASAEDARALFDQCNALCGI